MAVSETYKKLPVKEVFQTAGNYFEQNLKTMLFFSAISYLTMVAGVYSWKSLWFWPLMVGVYIFWSCFFRYYFNRRPYFEPSLILFSTVPSTKIVVLTALFATLLVVLPFAPLFMGFSADFNERYMQFLQNYMQESDYVDLGLDLLVVLVSPWLIYRPFMAWISALLGRSGTLKTAWNRTQNNFWEFLLVAVIFNLSFVFIQQLCSFLAIPLPLMLLMLAPLTVYFNLVLAKSYEFFFIDLD